MTYYTDRWNNFQIASPTYLDGHFEPNKFDIIKWVKQEEPIEVIDLLTGEKKLQSEYCFVVATLTWDPKELGFDFESCGIRYLEHYVDGLNEWILEFCKQKNPSVKKYMKLHLKMIKMMNQIQ